MDSLKSGEEVLTLCREYQAQLQALGKPKVVEWQAIVDAIRQELQQQHPSPMCITRDQLSLRQSYYHASCSIVCCCVCACVSLFVSLCVCACVSLCLCVCAGVKSYVHMYVCVVRIPACEAAKDMRVLVSHPLWKMESHLMDLFLLWDTCGVWQVHHSVEDGSW